jgi:Repeat of unknown function (DUF5907)
MVALTHSTVVVVPDDGTSPVGSDEWNAVHATSMTTNKLLGRATAGTGAIEEITLGTNLVFSGTTLNAAGGATITVGTTVVSGGTSGNFLYNNAAVLGEQTPTQITSNLDVFTSTLKGLAPSSGGGTANFLRADGTWTAPPSGGTPGGSSAQVQYNNAGVFGGFTVGGDATLVPSTGVLTIANQAVSYAKIQNISATSRLLGRITAGAGSAEELTAANAWTILGAMPAANEPAHTGDVTNTAGSLALTIGNAAVTYAKMQNISAASLLLGRGSAAGAGSPQEITLGTNLTMSGTTLNATGGGGTPGGSNTQLQYNNSTAFGGITNVISNGTNLTGIRLASTTSLDWDSGAAAVDLSLFRDAANILALRRTTNATGFRVFNTFTDASNYERGVFDWTTTANTLTIGYQKAGTGANRPINFVVAGSTFLTVDPFGNTTFSAAYGNSIASTNAGGIGVFNIGSTNAITITADTVLTRAAAGVFAIGTVAAVGNRNGWMQWAGQARVTADVNSNNTTALAIATGLTVALTAGRTYSFDVDLSFTCTAAQGIRAAVVASGGLTATAIVYDGWIIDSAANGTKGNAQATALGTVVANAATTGTAGHVQIRGTITVNVAGSLEVHFAQSVAAANNTAVLRGSRMIVHDMP